MSELLDRITIDPEICHGKPCIRGLRYPVEIILELLAGGATTEDILRDYEDLERDDVLAAKAFAATDGEICRLADVDGRVAVTKDADFVSSHLLSGRPARLLLVSVGNIANDDLERRVFAELPAIVLALSDSAFVELTTSGLVVHES